MHRLCYLEVFLDGEGLLGGVATMRLAIHDQLIQLLIPACR